jgi:hypothetical protein
MIAAAMRRKVHGLTKALKNPMAVLHYSTQNQGLLTPGTSVPNVKISCGFSFHPPGSTGY